MAPVEAGAYSCPGLLHEQEGQRRADNRLRIIRGTGEFNDGVPTATTRLQAHDASMGRGGREASTAKRGDSPKQPR
jgi:hypothetical protein